MKSVDNDELLVGVEENEVRIGVIFEDSDTPRYHHSIVWGFKPTLQTDSQNPILTVSNFIHKKYYREIDVNMTSATSDDGSNLVNSGGWGDKPFDTSCVPDSVKARFKSIFGDVLTKNTFDNAEDILDTELTDIDVPDIPDKHRVIIPKSNIQYSGRYSEDVEPDDPRIKDNKEKYKKEIKDEDGNVLSSSYVIDHHIIWWFSSIEGDVGIQVDKCCHKTWCERVSYSFKCEYETTSMVESHKKPSETPAFSELPRDLIKELCADFGEQFVRMNLDDPESELPRYAYECMDCDSVYVVTPRNNCPNCGNSSVIRHDSEESYINYIENETESQKEMKEWLCSAEVSISTD